MAELVESPPKDHALDVDRRAFAEFFFDLPRYRDSIAENIFKICIHVISDFGGLSPDDRDDAKDDAYVLAMDIVDRGDYDPARRTAYDYFYTIIKHQVGKNAKKLSRHSHLGDADIQVSFDDLQAMRPQDAARKARSVCRNNARTLFINHEISRMRLTKGLNVAEKKARRLLANEIHLHNRGERGAANIILATIREIRLMFLTDKSSART